MKHLNISIEQQQQQKHFSHLHGVSLPGGGLSVCENSAIVSTQNIYEVKKAETNLRPHRIYIQSDRK